MQVLRFRKEHRWYVLFVMLLIALVLITLVTSKRRMQQLEETKPKLGMVERRE